MINATKKRWNGFMEALGSLWSLWMTRFPTHLMACSSSKFEHMGKVTLLEGDVVSNII